MIDYDAQNLKEPRAPARDRNWVKTIRSPPAPSLDAERQPATAAPKIENLD
jgi:hypothetical protein